MVERRKDQVDLIIVAVGTVVEKSLFVYLFLIALNNKWFESTAGR